MSNKNKIILIVIIIASIIIGAIIGYRLHKCNSIESKVIKTDTIYRSYPIEVEKQTSKPSSTIIKKDTIIITKNKNVYDTVFINSSNPGYIYSDTINYDSTMYVSINGVGNCSGIIQRDALFHGTMKERIITNTITNNIAIPRNLIQINAGVTSSFANNFKTIDVGPCVMLSIRNNKTISYSYLIGNKSNQISVTTKIK